MRHNHRDLEAGIANGVGVFLGAGLQAVQSIRARREAERQAGWDAYEAREAENDAIRHENKIRMAFAERDRIIVDLRQQNARLARELAAAQAEIRLLEQPIEG